MPPALEPPHTTPKMGPATHHKGTDHHATSLDAHSEIGIYGHLMRGQSLTFLSPSRIEDGHNKPCSARLQGCHEDVKALSKKFTCKCAVSLHSW